MAGLTWLAFIVIFAHGKDGEVTGLTRSQCEQSARFESPKKGYALDGNVLASVNAGNAVNCVISCLQHPGCKSINFHVSANNDEHICELNSKTEDDVTLTVNSDVTYYGILQSQQLNCSQNGGPGECQNGGQCAMSCSRDGTRMCHCPADRTGLTCLDEQVANKSQDFAMVFPTKSIDNYISIQNNPPDMSHVTVLFWMNSFTTSTFLMLTYIAAGNSDLKIGFKPEEIVITVQDVKSYFPIPPITDDHWHHVGFTWSLGHYSVYLDGALIYSGDSLGSTVPIKGGGIFYIGSKLMDDGSFDPTRTFDGKLSQFNIWGEILTSGQINSTSKSCFNNVGTILDWSTVVTNASGDVVKEEPNSCKALRENPDYDITISANLSVSTQATHIVASDEISSLDQFTIAMWAKHSEYLRYVQYSSNGATSLSFRLHKDVLILEIAGATTKQARVPRYWKEAPAHWHHIATTWSSTTGRWGIYMDGSMVSIMHDVASGVTIPGGGELSLGLGNTESGDLSMDGSLSRLNIWDYEVNGLSLSMMANRGPLFENGNVFAWYGVKSKVVGDMVFQTTPSDLYNNRADAEYQMVFSAASYANYALLYDVFPNDITTFSACFWAKFTVTGLAILSYSTPGYDAEFQVYFYTSKFAFAIRSSYVYTPEVTFADRWDFHCTQWRSSDGLAEVYKSGVIIQSTPGVDVGIVIPSGGAMVIGQEPDSYAGGFSTTQAMGGYLAGINFWSDFLTPNEIQGMASGITNINGNLLQWRDLKGAIFGAVTTKKAYGALQEYRVQKLRDDWCKSQYGDVYARFVYNGAAYDWRCVRPSAMLAENMCYDVIGDSPSFFSKTSSILSFT